MTTARLYLCTDARRERGDLAVFADAALVGGVDIIQLRDKGSPGEQRFGPLEARDELAALEILADAAHRHGALSVTNLAIGKRPPGERPDHQPWPTMPNLFEIASAHEEGGERAFLASTVEFLSNDVGEVRALRVAETEFIDGKRVPKADRQVNADGSWREEIRQGKCVTVKEKSAAGEYKETRRCD